MVWQPIVAIILAVVLSQALGFLWYGPLFGQAWLKAMGFDKLSKKKLQKMQQEAMPGYAFSAAATAFATLLIWLVFVEWDLYSIMDAMPAPVAGLLVGAVGWAAFYFPGTFTSRFFSETTWAAWGIGAGYFLLMAMVEGLLVGIMSAI